MDFRNGMRILILCVYFVAYFSQCITSEEYKEPSTVPTQIHIALYDNTRFNESQFTHQSANKLGVVISWASTTSNYESSVSLGTDASNLSLNFYESAPSVSYNFCRYKSPYIHHVIIPMGVLEENTTYYYRCGSANSAWSSILSFHTPPSIGSRAPLRFGAIGDLGQTMYSKQTLYHLRNEQNLTAILHAGDLSYADSYQPRWDSWGELVSPLMSNVPWMMCAGNHEVERPCSLKTDPFIAFQTRYRMPYNTEDAVQNNYKNLFFGFRLGMVHVIVLTPYISTYLGSEQYQWLQDELKYVDRSRTPWLIVMMHAPWYNSNAAHQGQEPQRQMKKNMEKLLFDYHVDIIFCGHVHAYERSYPVYNNIVRNDGITYVVLGDGGNREGLAHKYLDPQPKWSAFREAKYGFGLFDVKNSTHAKMQWFADQEEGKPPILRDSEWLTTTSYRCQDAITKIE